MGWYNWTGATTAVHNLPNAWRVTQSAKYQRLMWYKEKVMHMHTASHGEGGPNSPPTHMSVTEVVWWWIAREHLKVVRRLFLMGPTLSPQSPPGSVREWWGSNTPVTLVSLLVTTHGVDHSYQLRVLL